jgi:hypothetical protein
MQTSHSEVNRSAWEFMKAQSTMKGLHTVLAAALVTAALAQTALAADDDLAQRIAACTSEQDAARRLAC